MPVVVGFGLVAQRMQIIQSCLVSQMAKVVVYFAARYAIKVSYRPMCLDMYCGNICIMLSN